MAPTATAALDAPMDLSTKARRKLRLEEFLRQNLDEAPAGRVIQWVRREEGVFRILWTHQSSGAFTHDDAALFRYWALARGKEPSLSSVELKQSLRMALNKSPSVQRLAAPQDEYRYFRFTGQPAAVQRAEPVCVAAAAAASRGNRLYSCHLTDFYTMSDQDHHHHAGEGGEEESLQCDHTKGIADHHIMDDPLMQKQDWDLNDYTQMYSKMEPSKSKGRPTPALVENAAALLPCEPCRVFLPLCGQTPDLRWLYDRGNTVVGLEGVELPVKNFFQLHSDLQYTVEELPFGKVYKTEDERLKVVVADVTQVPPDALGHFDAGFDWGSYTAISPSERPKYVELVRQVMRQSSTYFLEVCHDAPPDATGLPQSVPFRTVKLDFGNKWKLQVLKTEDISEAWGVESFFDSFILFTPKT